MTFSSKNRSISKSALRELLGHIEDPRGYLLGELKELQEAVDLHDPAKISEDLADVATGLFLSDIVRSVPIELFGIMLVKRGVRAHPLHNYPLTGYPSYRRIGVQIPTPAAAIVLPWAHLDTLLLNLNDILRRASMPEVRQKVRLI